jgi:hypothetical protein
MTGKEVGNLQNVINVLLLFLVICYSCNQNKSNMLIANIESVDCNYFECDSLQKIAGYYPLRVYFTIKIINPNKEKRGVSLSPRFGTTKYGFIAKNRMNTLKTYTSGKGDCIQIASNDSTFIKLIVDIPLDCINQNGHSLSDYINNITVDYLGNISCTAKEEPILIKKADSLIIRFRDSDSIQEEIDWI